MTILKVTILVCSVTLNALSRRFCSLVVTRCDSYTVTECVTTSSFLSDSKQTSVTGPWLANCLHKSNDLQLLVLFFLSCSAYYCAVKLFWLSLLSPHALGGKFSVRCRLQVRFAMYRKAMRLLLTAAAASNTVAAVAECKYVWSR
jgi:hypothetical protein